MNRYYPQGCQGQDCDLDEETEDNSQDGDIEEHNSEDDSGHPDFFAEGVLDKVWDPVRREWVGVSTDNPRVVAIAASRPSLIPMGGDHDNDPVRREN